MADTNRLIINEIDLSSSLQEETTSIVGYTVVKAPKGSITPIRIPAGGLAKLRDIFGASSKDYPELYEAETFLNSYDLFISAPYSKATVPAAYVTNDGIFLSDKNIEYNKEVENLVNGKEDEDFSIEGINNFSDGISILKNIKYPKTNGMGAKTDIASSYPSYASEEIDLIIDTGLTKQELSKLTKPLYLKITNMPEIYEDITSIVLEVREDGTVYQEATVTQSGSSLTEEKVGILASENKTAFNSCLDTDNIYIFVEGYDTLTSGLTIDTLDIITNTYIRDNLALESTRQNLELYWKVNIAEKDCKNYVHGILFPKYPSERALHINFQAFNSNRGYANNNASSRNILKMEVYEDGAFHNSTQTVSITGSLQSGATDASGATISFSDSNNSYAEQDLLFVYSDNPFTSMKGVNTNISQYPSIVLKGGTREFETEEVDSVELHNLGWTEAQDEDYSIVNIFFDSARNTPNTIFRSSEESPNLFYNLVTYHKQSSYIFNYSKDPNNVNNNMEILTFTFPDQLLGARYWNVCNEAIVLLNNGDKITSPMTGTFTEMNCRIIENKYGGAAPMWTNVRGMGGQLNISPLRLRYKYNKDQQDILNDHNFNPVILDHTYGVMVVGQRTCKVGEDTDWSYIGHVNSFLTFEREMRDNVLLPQLGKANNPYYRTLRKQQTDQLLAKRVNGDDRIWAQAFSDTSTADGINDKSALRQKQFKIKVGVKTDVFSETVIMNFTSYSQDTNLVDISEYTMGDEE